MKKLITTFCAIALTTVVAQAQTKDADVKPAVKKEAPAKLMNNAADSDASQTTEAEVAKGRAEYEAIKKSKKEAAPKKSMTSAAETKKVQMSDDANRKVEADKKKKDN